MSRRLRLLGYGALALFAAVVLAATARDVLRPGPRLAFAERSAPAGFRDLVMADAAEAGATTPSPPAAPVAAPVAAPDTASGAGICAALFDDPDDPRIGGGPVPVVYFTDYRCPYCKILGPLLFERAEAGEITLIVKEWPILGPASQAAARMALAAARQDAYPPAHDRLMHTAFAPTPAYAEELARGLGIDPGRLGADIADPAIAAHLARNAALAQRLGLPGTPGLVVGRTVAMRSVRERLLDALVAAERELGPPPC